MKKIFIAMCMAVAALTASAQQGKMGLGVDFGVVPFLEGEGSPTNIEIGAKFQYGISENVRLEAALDYAFKSDYTDVLTFSGNVHYLIPVVDSFKLYPLAGIGYGRVGFSTDVEIEGMDWEASTSLNRFLFNVGLGGEYAISDNLAINLEFKYQYMKDFNRMPVKLGVTYSF